MPKNDDDVYHYTGTSDNDFMREFDVPNTGGLRRSLDNAFDDYDSLLDDDTEL